MGSREEQIKQLDEIKVGAVVVSGAKNFVTKRPVTVSLWVLGLLVAAFANGFAVSPTQLEGYSISREQAEAVERDELQKVLQRHRKVEDAYYNAKGWFSCDARCQAMKDKLAMSQSEVDRVTAKRDALMTSARQEVGIWSVFGVRDIRASFWSAWQSGKDTAARMTMWDAMFAMFSDREESLMATILQLVVQYVINLTLGLVTAFVFFMYNVYNLIVAYGEPAMSGIAFFLLVLVAGASVIATYLTAIGGTVAGGGFLLVRQAAKQSLQNGEQGRAHPRRVQYGRPQRSHFD